MSCVAFVIWKMMLLFHFWVIEEDRKVFPLLRFPWILCGPLPHRGVSQTGTEGVHMAWLAMLPFKMTALCFPFECVKVNKTSAASIYDAEGGIRLFMCWRKLAALSQGGLWIPLLFVFCPLCSLYSLPPLSPYPPEHMMYIKMLLGPTKESQLVVICQFLRGLVLCECALRAVNTVPS